LYWVLLHRFRGELLKHGQLQLPISLKDLFLRIFNDNGDVRQGKIGVVR